MCVRLFATSWTAALQAPLSMGFSRQEYWSGLPFPSPGDLPNPGIKPESPVLQADALSSEPPGKLVHKPRLKILPVAMKIKDPATKSQHNQINKLILKKKKEYWSGLPFPAPGDLPNPGIKPGSPALQADSLLS